MIQLNLDEEQIIHFYTKEKLSSLKISLIFNCSAEKIRTILKNNKIERTNKFRKYKIRQDFFNKINTQEKAYLLGFLLADGTSNGKHYIALDLQERDIEIIEMLEQAIYVKETPKRNRRIFDNGNIAYRITICSKNIVEDLKKYGMVKNKTKNLLFPQNIKREMLNHLIRGNFDGDGSFSVNKERAILCFNGTYDFIEGLQEVLIRETGIKKTKIFRTSSIFRLSVSSMPDTYKVINYLQNNSTHSLSRKKTKMENWKKQYEKTSNYQKNFGT